MPDTPAGREAVACLGGISWVRHCLETCWKVSVDVVEAEKIGQGRDQEDGDGERQ